MILMNDFKAEPEELLQREMVAVERVLRSGWYVLGSEVKTFEAAWL
jgi:dTDP-4-amino-4,6-dideoxygalactose transaminase